MAYFYVINFKKGVVVGSKPAYIKTNKSGLKIEKNARTTAKCFEFVLNYADKISVDELSIEPVKTCRVPWLYGPATLLKTQRVIYPCSRYRCSLP